ncbi:hypothetical protein L228DRAFT_197893, partial [Xylona heveae TC161]
RVRSKKACDSCRQRKRKCDGNRPCGTCMRYEYECTYPKTNRRKHATITNDPTSPPVAEGPGSYTALSPVSSEKPPNPGEGHNDGTLEQKSDSQPSVAPRDMTQYKCRFIGPGSAVAFTRDVGVDLQLSSVPRLHSYAWNTGMRLENIPRIDSRITTLISLDCCQRFSSAYFQAVNPLFPLLDAEQYATQCAHHWSRANAGTDFEAVVSIVIALGSLFSPQMPCLAEAELVGHAHTILDAAISQPPTTLSLYIVIGWILLSLYQRLTTRPTISWMSINIAMHLAESTGLHQEIVSVQNDRNVPPRVLEPEELETRRRVFWVAWSLNRFFAGEMARSRVKLNNIHCLKPAQKEGDFVNKLISLTELIPDNVGYSVNNDVEADMKTLLEKLPDLGDGPPIFSLLKADVCFQCYRRLRLFRRGLKGEQTESILGVIRSSVAEARKLCNEQQPWWNILSTTFQSLLVLISINTASSISLIPDVTQALGEIAAGYNTHNAREALQISQQMVRKLLERKREEVCALENAS